MHKQLQDNEIEQHIVSCLSNLTVAYPPEVKESVYKEFANQKFLTKDFRISLQGLLRSKAVIYTSVSIISTVILIFILSILFKPSEKKEASSPNIISNQQQDSLVPKINETTPTATPIISHKDTIPTTNSTITNTHSVITQPVISDSTHTTTSITTRNNTISAKTISSNQKDSLTGTLKQPTSTPIQNNTLSKKQKKPHKPQNNNTINDAVLPVLQPKPPSTTTTTEIKEEE